MIAPERELCGLEVKGAEFVEARRADAGEFVQELREGFAAALFDMAPAVEFVEGFGFAMVEDAACPG